MIKAYKAVFQSKVVYFEKKVYFQKIIRNYFILKGNSLKMLIKTEIIERTSWQTFG